MAPLFALLGLLGFLTSFVSATALTYKLPPNGKECFYSHIEQKGAKVAFYFAVQSGGSFDVDYAVHGPSSEPGREKTILDGTKERQGDFVFTANEAGEYRFCFDNSISTFADKMIDFEISIENEPRAASIPSKQGANIEQTSALENSVLKLSGQLSTITRQQKYFRTRENRNFSTVRSTEQRIFNFSIIESLMMVAMAGMQVFIVRMFFQTGRKGGFLYQYFLHTAEKLTQMIQVTSRKPAVKYRVREHIHKKEETLYMLVMPLDALSCFHSIHVRS
ncbi:supernatant protein factor, C-terminal domain-containing protein [Aureobasidium sp. EXF-12298]|nr:supernatant protein factor, C-terminal domain-containing protein [Aureobasidium sp. EXF-12298]